MALSIICMHYFRSCKQTTTIALFSALTCLQRPPHHVRVRDEALAFRHLHGADRILHQIGNNPDHISVVQGLRDWGGVVTLHGCCIVSDTASYSELSKDAVVHIPIGRPIPHQAAAALTTLRRQLRVAQFDLRALPAVLPLPIDRQRPSLSNTGT